MRMIKFLKSTLIKYILSYILILVVFMFGLYAIINLQLKQEYTSIYINDSKRQISSVGDMIYNYFSEIQETQMLVTDDVDIISERYANESYSQYIIVNEMKKYISRDSIVSDMIYVDLKFDAIYSINNKCDFHPGGILITRLGDNILIPEEFYLSDEYLNKVTLIQNGKSKMYFFSAWDNSENRRIISILNADELENILGLCLYNGVSGIQMIDGSGTPILSVGTEFAVPAAVLENGSSQETEGYFTKKIPYPSVDLVAQFDLDFFQDRINDVFIKSYILWGAITIAGFIIILFLLKLVYVPIYRFRKNITKNGTYFLDDISALDHVFRKTNELNSVLSERIKNYKTVIYQSVLNTKTVSGNLDAEVLNNIDILFSSENKVMMAVKVIFEEGGSEKEIEAFLKINVYGKFNFILFEEGEKYLTFFLTWEVGGEDNDFALNRILEALVQQFDCKVAFSDYSSTPLDIPKMYRNVSIAEKYVTQENRIVGYDAIAQNLTDSDVSGGSDFTHKAFDRLANSLEKQDFEQCFLDVKALFDTMDMETSPEMFVRFTLIDTITLIGNFMNAFAVKYEKYNQIFNDTLSLCRKSDYVMKKDEIINNINEMIKILSQEVLESHISQTQIESYVCANCFNVDFSITLLADHFGVSVAYMSFLFKKKLNINFSNYVWNLRYEKAKELLMATDYSIEKIGLLVGYENSSSFRRKFKEEAGISPSQYRKDFQAAD